MIVADRETRAGEFGRIGARLTADRETLAAEFRRIEAKLVADRETWAGDTNLALNSLIREVARFQARIDALQLVSRDFD